MIQGILAPLLIKSRCFELVMLQV